MYNIDCCTVEKYDNEEGGDNVIYLIKKFFVPREMATRVTTALRTVAVIVKNFTEFTRLKSLVC